MTTAVWVYARDSHKPNQTEALALSLKMARQNIVGATNFVVIGDKPPVDWVDWIDSPRKPPKLHDSALKLTRACDDPSITETFVRLYDDHFILKPTTIEELAVPRHNGIGSMEPARQSIRKPKTKSIPFPMPGRGYHEKKRETFRRIGAADPLDYSYHPIVVFEKSKLKQTMLQFDLLNKPALIESLYLNQWAENPTPVLSSFFRNISCINDWWFPHSLPNIVCVYNKCVGKVLAEHLNFYAESIGVE